MAAQVSKCLLTRPYRVNSFGALRLDHCYLEKRQSLLSFKAKVAVAASIREYRTLGESPEQLDAHLNHPVWPDQS